MIAVGRSKSSGIRYFRRAAVAAAAMASLLFTASATAAPMPVWHVTQQQHPSQAEPGSVVTFAADINNLGSVNSSGPVTATVALPPGTTAVSAGDEWYWQCPGASGENVVTCTVIIGNNTNYGPDVLARSGAAKRLEIVAQLPASASAGDVAVTVSGGGGATEASSAPLVVGPEPTGFGIADFSGWAVDAAGGPAKQAGSHPDVTTEIDFGTSSYGLGLFRSVGNVKDIEVELPPGLVGNPTAAPTCPLARLADPEMAGATCRPESQVGVVQIVHGGAAASDIGLYNVEAPPGQPAQLGFNVGTVIVMLNPTIRTGGDYGITAQVTETSQSLSVVASKVTIWGVPADPSHDGQRFAIDPNFGPYPGSPSAAPKVPFMTAPTSCPGTPMTTRVRANAWGAPLPWHQASFAENFDGSAFVNENCHLLEFKPRVSVAPTMTRADAPTGLSVEIVSPQNLEDPSGLASAQLRNVKVTLPDGLTISPAAAAGLTACSDEQLAVDSARPPACPDAAKIGTVSAETPLLAEPLSGSVYVGAQRSDDPASGEMFRLFLAFENEERGVLVKLKGRVRVSPSSGRVVAEFDDNPQLPVERISLKLKGGAHAPLVTPASCGPKAIATQLQSWAGQEVTLTSSFEVDCRAGLGDFAPSFSAGTMDPIAGASSPFVLRAHKPDGHADINGVELTLPEGLLASLRGNLGSRVGTAWVGSGPGPDPFRLEGAVTLEGPYRDAPFSLRVAVPVLAGPFNLGEVVVRQRVFVDPTDAHVTVVSDPLPTIVKGVPVRLQDLAVDIDKSSFMLNPTDCSEKKISATFSSVAGQKRNLSSRFQVGACRALSFKPSLKLSVKGPTHRSAHPRLKAVLTMPKGGANIEKAQVTLPKTEILENAHIRTICTRVQYAAQGGGGKACPPASVYGKAKAWSPLLDKPLEGPVFLRSSSNPLPDLVASLDGQIHVDLVGRIDSVNARIRNTFEGVPDAPVSKFVLEMQGGKKGLLVNNTELCKTTPRATVKFDGQNGKLADSSPVMRADCGKKAKKGGAKKKR